MLKAMAENPHAEHLQELLEGLNEPQREAVTHGEGPLLILAGAGSGKTRVLTHRVAFLIYTDQAQAGEILAITFTNKAAKEMRERVERLLGHSTRGMWLMTFHAACARILRAEAERLGYTRQFTIYDQADARRLTKRCMDAVGVDPKRYTPAAIHNQISSAKNKLNDASAYSQAVGSQFEELVGEVYTLYERDLMRMNAMDFDDLLFRTVNLLELYPEVRERYSESFRHVLVDEYQDTNHAQYRFLQLLAGGGQPPRRSQAERGGSPSYAGPVGHRNLAVVGDDSQCLAGGTLITMADGTQRPVEDVQPGEQVLAAYGSGDFRPAVVSRCHQTSGSAGVAITTRAGRRLISTPEHVHFAGFVVGRTPQLHMTYLMWKDAVGFRVGTSRTYTAGQSKPVIGARLRVNSEGADAAWVISVHTSGRRSAGGRARAVCTPATDCPRLPFYARPSSKACDSRQRPGDDRPCLRGARHCRGGAETTRRRGAQPALPAHRPNTDSHRLSGTPPGRVRRRMVLHPVWRPARALSDAPDRHVWLRRARKGDARTPWPQCSAGTSRLRRTWRYETASKDMRSLLATAERVRGQLDCHIHLNARLARNVGGMTNTLPFMPASALRRGMVMVGADGEFDLIESVERIALAVPVYDLDVQGVHNFIANGLVTHNSIYSFRGAAVENILGFQEDFPDARVVKLEQNYRSTETILKAANAVIANNRGGIAKRLWSELEHQASRCTSASSTTSTPRRASSWARSSDSSTRAPRARRLRSSTAPTRCRA